MERKIPGGLKKAKQVREDEEEGEDQLDRWIERETKTE